MNQNNSLMGIKTNIVYGNPRVKRKSKNEEVHLSREYSNESPQQRIERILAEPLPEKKMKGGKK